MMTSKGTGDLLEDAMAPCSDYDRTTSRSSTRAGQDELRAAQQLHLKRPESPTLVRRMPKTELIPAVREKVPPNFSSSEATGLSLRPSQILPASGSLRQHAV